MKVLRQDRALRQLLDEVRPGFMKEHNIRWANIDYDAWKKQLTYWGLLDKWISYIRTLDVSFVAHYPNEKFIEDFGGLARARQPVA